MFQREISTYHRNSACPDFIFYSSASQTGQASSNGDTTRYVEESHIRLMRRLTLPTLQELQSTCGPMPNEQTGSDHLPLMAEFEVVCQPMGSPSRGQWI